MKPYALTATCLLSAAMAFPAVSDGIKTQEDSIGISCIWDFSRLSLRIN